MKKTLLDCLVCPICRNDLSIFELETRGSEIGVGILQCKQFKNHIFPIIRGIPRMLEDSLAYHAKELKNYKEIVGCDFKKATGPKNLLSKEYKHIQKSFSSEWSKIKDKDYAWGQDLQCRRDLFFKCIDKEPSAIEGMRVLDAGCGHGEVVLSLLDFNLEIFAVDISDAVDQLKKRTEGLNNHDREKIHIIQGNIFSIPFKSNLFDIVYCAGVLHHTPNTFETFKSVSNTLKKSGGIYFVELYSMEHKNCFEKFLIPITDLVRKITYRLPHNLLHFLCYIGAPFLWLYINIFNNISGSKRYQARSIKESELSLFDSLSPRYDWRHYTEEVKNWFRALGYTNIKKTFFNQNVIGVRGELKSSGYNPKV